MKKTIITIQASAEKYALYSPSTRQFFRGKEEKEAATRIEDCTIIEEINVKTFLNVANREKWCGAGDWVILPLYGELLERALKKILDTASEKIDECRVRRDQSITTPEEDENLQDRISELEGELYDAEQAIERDRMDLPKVKR